MSVRTKVIQEGVRTVAGKRAPLTCGPKRAAMSLTPAATNRVRSLLSQQPGASALRIGVKTRGCSGMSYTIDYQDERPSKFDEVVDIGDEQKIVIDPKALLHVIGTTMDFIDSKVASEFVFNNPNATGVCGCGESFTTGNRPAEPPLSDII
uniref:Core domain-containing protein n=1 Tax=Paramoeba aestuarina TaxID=180227 RepID=A0A7S4JIG3_9EUKA|mmetsp:Transcript_10724/g.16157  ORF Transcript_10724/g.16157 Transcript_10724/m.16157 type:complete len:151 (+) Transcript_10724:32-484(+)